MPTSGTTGGRRLEPAAQDRGESSEHPRAGVTQQSESTADMIFSCAEIISWLSNNMTLIPGQVILTGTPSGVAAGRTPPNWLKVGDVVECEVDRIGILSNTIAAPKSNL